MTCDMWQGSSDMWHLTCDTRYITHMVWWVSCENCRSLALTVPEWLKTDMWHKTQDTWHVTKDMWQMTGGSLVHHISPWTIKKTICLVSNFYIISKSTLFLLKTDLHCNLPNFINVSNTSAPGLLTIYNLF